MKAYTEGSLVQAMLRLAGPIVMTNVLSSLYLLTDTFWVGRLGEDAVAAVALSFPLTFLLFTLANGFSIAGAILVAQYKGQENQAEINRVATQMFVIVVGVSSMLGVVGWGVAEPFLAFLGASETVMPMAVDYIRWSAVGFPFVFGYYAFQGVFRGVGEVRVPMMIILGTVLLNLILDPLFIFGWGPVRAYGVAGAAVATMGTQALALVAAVWLLHRGTYGVKTDWGQAVPSWGFVRQLFALGGPASVEQGLKAVSFVVMSGMVALFGTTVTAAYGLGIRVLGFVIIPAFGVAMATSTLVGQNIGAQKPERARKAGMLGVAIGAGMLTVMAIIVGPMAELIVRVFVPDEPEVIAMGAEFVRWMSVGFPFLGVNVLVSGVFQGARNTRLPMVFSLITLLVLELPIAYVLAFLTPMEELGLWVSMPIAAAISTMMVSWFFWRRAWHKSTAVV